MIVQCAQCSAKFRLDDAKIRQKGVKVRCSKCKHIFVVTKEQSAEEPDFDSILNRLDTSADVKSEEASTATSIAESAPVARESEPAEPAGFSVPDVAGAGEFSADFFANGEPELPVPESDAKADVLASFATPDEGSAKEVAQTSEGEGASVDFAAFSGEKLSVPESDEFIPETEIPETSFSQVPEEDAEAETEISFEFPDAETALDGKGGASFASDDLFVDSSRPSFVVDEGEADDFAEFSREVDEAESVVDEPLDFGEIDFGIEAPPAATPSVDLPADLGVGQAATEISAEASTPVVPLVAAPEAGKEAVSQAPVFSAAQDEELPPLSISSRRKGPSLLPITVTAFSVLLIVALAGAGFYFFKEGPSALDKFGLGFVADWLGVEMKEEGKIGLEKVEGAFVKNSEAGELFVIKGEAVNNYKKPRASIQVKGIIFGANGQVIAQKTAYCGNALSADQLSTLPLAKFEAAMNNQFGDSLSNLGLQPGKRIPFVIVFAGVSSSAADYGVELAGSTVASQ